MKTRESCGIPRIPKLSRSRSIIKAGLVALVQKMKDHFHEVDNSYVHKSYSDEADAVSLEYVSIGACFDAVIAPIDALSASLYRMHSSEIAKQISSIEALYSYYIAVLKGEYVYARSLWNSLQLLRDDTEQQYANTSSNILTSADHKIHAQFDTLYTLIQKLSVYEITLAAERSKTSNRPKTLSVKSRRQSQIESKM